MILQVRVSKPLLPQDHGLRHCRRNTGNLTTDPPTTGGTRDSQLKGAFVRQLGNLSINKTRILEVEDLGPA